MHFAFRVPAALALVILLIGSIAEPAVGLLRDADVHHKSPASAAAHRANASGDHGHEDQAGAASRSGHGPQHEHGTAADHCTHAHGIGLPSYVVLHVPVRVSTLGDERAISWRDHPVTTPTPPPRA